MVDATASKIFARFALNLIELYKVSSHFSDRAFSNVSTALRYCQASSASATPTLLNSLTNKLTALRTMTSSAVSGYRSISSITAAVLAAD